MIVRARLIGDPLPLVVDDGALPRLEHPAAPRVDHHQPDRLQVTDETPAVRRRVPVGGRRELVEHGTRVAVGRAYGRQDGIGRPGVR